MWAEQYSSEPREKVNFTEYFDTAYTRIALFYDAFVKICPFWRRWLRSALPHIEGPCVLEVSFGTGYLLTQYAKKVAEVHGVDLNEKMLATARNNLEKEGITSVRLVRANVEDLPYGDNYFDSIIVTMAFTGYPDGHRAMSELKRVLKQNGRLIMVDIGYPKNSNWAGVLVTNLWKAAGDIIRDMGALLNDFDLGYTEEEVGGFGSVHLYVAKKKQSHQ